MKKWFLIFSILLALDLSALGYLEIKNGRPLEHRLVEQFAPQAGFVHPVVIHFLDIGQGDASYIQFPDGEDMLVDCSKDAGILQALGRVMKEGDNTIDYLLVTHPHADHYAGCIDVLKQFTVRHIVYTGLQSPNDAAWKYFWDLVQKEGALYQEINHRQTWTVASTTIKFLYPDHSVSQDKIAFQSGDSGHDVNNSSLVFTLAYGKERVLFTGDMEQFRENYLLQKYGPADFRADILKVGHHGSATASGDAFLQAVQPTYATISVGKGNTYGLPSLRVIKKLERVGAEVFRTDEQGDITAMLDETHATVRAK